jgi:UDP-N-acetylmuramoylalanine--D-glutamate ligase
MSGGIGELYRGQTVLVAGAARSGVASAEFLLLRGARVVLTDAKNEESLPISLAPLRRIAQTSGELVLELGGHKLESFRECDFVVISPGVPLAHPLFEESRKAGIPILAEVELAFRHLKGKILGITGSNGKTTTTTLVAELLRGPACEAMPRETSAARLSVLHRSRPRTTFMWSSCRASSWRASASFVLT